MILIPRVPSLMHVLSLQFQVILFLIVTKVHISTVSLPLKIVTIIVPNMNDKNGIFYKS